MIVVIASSNRSALAQLACEQSPTVKMLLEMLIMASWNFPPPFLPTKSALNEVDRMFDRMFGRCVARRTTRRCSLHTCLYTYLRIPQAHDEALLSVRMRQLVSQAQDDLMHHEASALTAERLAACLNTRLSAHANTCTK